MCPRWLPQVDTDASRGLVKIRDQVEKEKVFLLYRFQGYCQTPVNTYMSMLLSENKKGGDLPQNMGSRIVLDGR